MIGSLILFLFGPVLRTVQVSSLCITIHFQNAHLLVSHVTIECWDDVNKKKRRTVLFQKNESYAKRKNVGRFYCRDDDSFVVFLFHLKKKKKNRGRRAGPCSRRDWLNAWEIEPSRAKRKKKKALVCCV